MALPQDNKQEALQHLTKHNVAGGRSLTSITFSQACVQSCAEVAVERVHVFQ